MRDDERESRDKQQTTLYHTIQIEEEDLKEIEKKRLEDIEEGAVDDDEDDGGDDPDEDLNF